MTSPSMDPHARTYSAHEVIELYSAAQPFAQTRFAMVGLPSADGWLAFLPERLRKKIQPIMMVIQHMAMVRSVYRCASTVDLLFIREFLTLPFVFMVWAVLPFRRKLCVINVHNLQRATTRGTHRVAFKLLCSLGLKIAFLEGMEGLDCLNIAFNPQQYFVLPHAAFPVRYASLEAPRLRPRIGVIGAFRPEKGADTLIKHLCEIQQQVNVDILVGTRDTQSLRSFLSTFSNEVKVVDTSTSEMFVAALAQCDIVLFNYKQEDYYFRGSGVITNAIECGACVICPNYPIFVHEVMDPAPVGTTFDTDDGIVAAVIETLQRIDTLKHNMEAYFAYRSPQAIANRIDAFAKGNHLIS